MEYSPIVTQAYLQAHFDAYLQDLTALVAIDSGTHNRAGVNRVADWIAARAGEYGWETERYPVETAGDGLRVTLRGAGTARLLLLGHMDTVYPDGTAAARPLRREGTRLLGPGVSDMKSGLLSGLWALRALQAQDFTDFAELTLFCNPDEETGSQAGAALYMPLVARADAALVLESARANGDLVSARKGGGVYTLRVHGRAAHAGIEPEKGANAVVELARHVLAAAALDGLQPGVGVHVDVIHGGTKSNVIPEYAEALVDVRAADAAGLRAVDGALRALAGHTTLPGTRLEVAGDVHATPMPKTPGNALLVEFAQAAALDLDFAARDAPITGGTSDANFVAAAGVPVIDGLGPIGGGDHSPAEYLMLDSIIPRTAMLAGIIVRACGARARLSALRS